MPRTRPPYPPEFRAEAIRLLRASGRSIPQLARELGVSAQTLRNWATQSEIDAPARRLTRHPHPPERAEADVPSC